jgi:lantibiotic modifying enzyme
MNPAGAILDLPLQIPVQGGRGEEVAFLDRAVSIAEYIRAEAVPVKGGDVAWFTPPPAEGRPRRALDPHLYSGTVGVVYFLAALNHLRGTAEYRDLALRGIAPLRRKIADLTADAERAAQNQVPVGGLVGVGSFIYGLVRAAKWLDEPAMIGDAQRAMRLLPPARIRGDDQLDVVRGCAGTILGLLALDEVAPGPNADGVTPMDLAWTCAEYLLGQRVSHDGGPRAWPCEGRAPRTGFAHGAAGTSYALLRMAERTGARELREAGLEGFAFERRLYDHEKRTWWDPPYDRFLQLHSWCFGAPGMALSRLVLLGSDADGAELRAELAETLDITATYPDEPVDHLCCGNLGRTEVLVSAARALGEPALLAPARGLALRAIQRAPGEEDFGLIPPGDVPVLRHSLWRGVAGIGYALLRLVDADGRLPSPLCME